LDLPSGKPENTPTVWTQALREQLVELWDSGIPVSEIALKMGLTKNTVVGKAHRLFCKPRQSPIKSDVSLVKLTEEQKRERINERRRKVTDESRKARGLPPFVRGKAAPKAPPKQQTLQRGIVIQPWQAEAPVRPAGEPVTFGAPRTCQYLQGDPAKLLFCDQPVCKIEKPSGDVVPSVYCEAHHRICYVKIWDKHRRQLEAQLPERSAA
jgi:GcrA cell cycle regulator